MQYSDEKILKQRLDLSAKKSHSIINKVKIDDVEYSFKRRDFEYGFSMIVPESFQTMPQDIAKRKFPYEDRPPIIIASDDNRVCIAFNTDKPQTESLLERLEKYKAVIKRLNPANVFFLHNIVDTIHELKIACYDYMYPAVDADIYNLTFISDLKNCELIGWFICPQDLSECWECLAREMIASINILEE